MILVVTNMTAERAWNRSENRDRCEPVPESGSEVVGIPSWGTTPGVETGELPASKIHLSFDDKPRNLEKGFVFGSEPQKCDVLLGPWPGFSRQHFRITFNEQGGLNLMDTSRAATCVVYNGEEPSFRKQFTWILFPKHKNIRVVLNGNEHQNKNKEENKNELTFKVEWPRYHDPFSAQYKAHRDAYLEERRNALPSLNQLAWRASKRQRCPQHNILQDNSLSICRKKSSDTVALAQSTRLLI